MNGDSLYLHQKCLLSSRENAQHTNVSSVLLPKAEKLEKQLKKKKKKGEKWRKILNRIAQATVLSSCAALFQIQVNSFSKCSCQFSVKLSGLVGTVILKED